MHQDTVSAIEGGLSKIQARRRANQAALQAELAKTNRLARQLRAAGLLR